MNNRFLALLLLGPAVAGQSGPPACVSMKLRPVTSWWPNKSAHDVLYHVEKFRADSRGGQFQFFLIGQEACKGRSQRFNFEWTFDRDLSVVRAVNKTVAFRVRFSGQADDERCINANWPMALYRAGNAIGWQPDQQYYVWPERAGIGSPTAERDFYVGVNPDAMSDYAGHGPEIGFALPSLRQQGGDFFRVAYYFDYERCEVAENVRRPPPELASYQFLLDERGRALASCDFSRALDIVRTIIQRYPQQAGQAAQTDAQGIEAWVRYRQWMDAALARIAEERQRSGTLSAQSRQDLDQMARGVQQQPCLAARMQQVTLAREPAAAPVPRSLVIYHTQQLQWPSKATLVKQQGAYAEYTGADQEGRPLILRGTFQAGGRASFVVENSGNGFRGTYEGTWNGQTIEGRYTPSAGFGTPAYFKAEVR